MEMTLGESGSLGLSVSGSGPVYASCRQHIATSPRHMLPRLLSLLPTLNAHTVKPGTAAAKPCKRRNLPPDQKKNYQVQPYAVASQGPAARRRMSKPGHAVVDPDGHAMRGRWTPDAGGRGKATFATKAQELRTRHRGRSPLLGLSLARVPVPGGSVRLTLT